MQSGRKTLTFGDPTTYAVISSSVDHEYLRPVLRCRWRHQQRCQITGPMACESAL